MEKLKIIIGKVHFLGPAYLSLFLAMFVLPVFSFAGYSILENTTSQLGAQNTPNAWIMNLVFIMVGFASIIEGWIHLKAFWFHKFIITIFGLTLILTALFQTAPIVEGVPFNDYEDKMHTFFANIVGFSFAVFAFSAAFIVRTTWERVLALLVSIMAIGLSVLMFSIDGYAGLFQRMMFMIAFAWLIFFLSRMSSKWKFDE